MDFEDSSQEAQFRREVRGWLAENAAQYRQRFPAGIGVEEDLTQDIAILMVPLAFLLLLFAYLTPSVSIREIVRAAQEHIEEQTRDVPRLTREGSARSPRRDGEDIAGFQRAKVFPSAGSAEKNWRRRNVPKAPPQKAGSQRGTLVPIKCSHLKMMKLGIKVT
jgi:hypothetical protein